MSVPPSKRSHEEGGNGSGSFSHMSISKYPHVDSTALPGTGSKLTSSGTTDYHTSHEVAQESRMQKIPRTEVRDPDRKSPLVPMFRTSSSSNDVRSDRPAGIESRMDFKESWNNNRDFKVETKIESRNLHQVAKVEKDRKIDAKTEDNKETNPEKDTYAERKNDVKSDKEGSGLVSSQLNWKDSKDHYWGKSYPDDIVGNVDSRYSSRAIPHGPAEAGKQGSNTEGKEHHEFHEIVGRNKIDLKGDDKVKDKDMKRKEGKHRDWGEVDKERSDRRNTLPLGGSSIEKDVLKDEREAEKWTRERKDMLKDKEKPKEIEEIMKKESWRGAEKESPHKESVDISGSHADQDEVVSEQKKQNENLKERKEIDGEVHGERADTHNRFNDKESDEGMDAEGGTGKEKEGTQHRKKMLRPRASPRANRDPHISHSQDIEGQVCLESQLLFIELVNAWKKLLSCGNLNHLKLIGVLVVLKTVLLLKFLFQLSMFPLQIGK
ncbi:hypothetical protein Leryth_001953 [Lithospermum erythrorhizon]|nr:hypothetical protein Leryth_001953 [Lithospermum erythrorhizon]